MERRELQELWEERRAQFEQCLQLQLYLRDAEQTNSWMAKQEVGVVRTTGSGWGQLLYIHVWGWGQSVDVDIQNLTPNS